MALGTCLLFSPFAGSLTVAFIHLLTFGLFCFCELKQLLMGAKLLKVAMGLLNLVLMIIGTVGINYNQFCKNSLGAEVCCS